MLGTVGKSSHGVLNVISWQSYEIENTSNGEMGSESFRNLYKVTQLGTERIELELLGSDFKIPCF